MKKNISSLRDSGYEFISSVTNIKSLRDFVLSDAGCVVKQSRKNEILVKKTKQKSPVGTIH